MAHVPAVECDLFIGYAHEDAAWVAEFEGALKDRLKFHDLMVDVWRDDPKLRIGDNWRETAGSALLRSAAFVAVTSPDYLRSKPCEWEYRRFRREAPSRNVYRVVLSPCDSGAEDCLYQAFYGKVGKIDQRFPSDSEDFVAAIAKLAADVAAHLQELRGAHPKVHVASCVEDPAATRSGLGADPAADAERLRSELVKHGYNVQPERWRLDVQRDARRRDVEASVVSVQCLGRAFDPLTAEEIDLAAELEVPLFIWATRTTREAADPQQKQLFDAIRAGLAPGGRRLPRYQDFDDLYPMMVNELKEILKRESSRPAAAPAGAGPRVNVICHSKTEEDVAFAQEIRRQILEKEPRFDVEIPEESQQREKLLTCDGVLLYREAAPYDWFVEHLRSSVLFLEQKLNRLKPVRSKAVVVDHRMNFKGSAKSVNVIRRTSTFSVADLEPFLAPLRG